MVHNIFCNFLRNLKKKFVNLKKSIGCPTRTGFLERNAMSENRSERASKNCQNSPRIFRNDKMTKIFFYHFCRMAKNGDFSPGTKALIDRMMKEKKISFRQQKQITRAMSVGQALPVEGRYFEH